MCLSFIGWGPVNLTKERFTREKQISYHVHCVYMWEHSTIRNSQGWLEFGRSILTKEQYSFRETTRQRKRSLIGVMDCGN